MRNLTLSLFSKHTCSLGYNMPVALWSATEISNDRAPQGTRVREGAGYA